jgi:hypothetical protein
MGDYIFSRLKQVDASEASVNKHSMRYALLAYKCALAHIHANEECDDANYILSAAEISLIIEQNSSTGGTPFKAKSSDEKVEQTFPRQDSSSYH